MVSSVVNGSSVENGFSDAFSETKKKQQQKNNSNNKCLSKSL